MSSEKNLDYFKGWAKPGPPVPGEMTAEPDTESLDALSGHFRIFQLKKGHRFSTDDLLAAWYGCAGAPSVRTILDLGSGIGTAAMVAAWKNPGARVVTIEAQSESVRLAKKSVQYNGLSDRFDIRESDLRAPAILAKSERFDLILGTPPYFPEEAGIHGDHPQKIACRFELRGTIADYCTVASRHLELGGFFASVFPIDPPWQKERVFSAALGAGLTIVRMRPVVLKEGEVPLLGLFGMMKSEHLPESYRAQTFEEAPLVIRRKDGAIHPEYSAVKLSIGFPP